MNPRAIALRALFQRLVFTGMVPVAGCGATVVSTDVRIDAPPSQDVPPPPSRADVSPPPDARNCAPVVSGRLCERIITFPCGDAPHTAQGAPDCTILCGRPREDAGFDFGCEAKPAVGSASVYVCPVCAVGRRVEEFTPAAPFGVDAVGGYFATVSQLEAASVAAFSRLARELEVHGAPADLVEEARRAAHDERRHARDTARLARTRGAQVQRLPRLSTEVRSLRALAVDNAVEGCVRETFGALVATWQAARANAPDVARVMDVIAQEETRHAALSWSVAAWLEGLLSDDDRDAVSRAHEEAVAGLLDELAAPVDPALVRDAGMPDADCARALARCSRRCHGHRSEGQGSPGRVAAPRRDAP